MGSFALAENDRGAIFTLWCLCGVFSSLYSSAWVRLEFSEISIRLGYCSQDLFMDWSLLNLSNTKSLLLRSELLYPNHVPVSLWGIVPLLRC